MASSQVLDEARQRVHAKRLAVEKHKQEVRDWCAREERNSVYLRDNDFLNIGNAEAQMGTALYNNVFEKMLAPLLPANVFVVDNTTINPASSKNHRSVMQRLPDGTVKTLCPFEKGLMPERSIIKCKEKLVRDASVWHLDRKDTPKAEYRDGEFHYEEGTVKPGWKKITEPYGEARRGWRTVLIQLVKAGILSVPQVESKFGADNTRAWAGHTGKMAVELPW